MADLSTSDTPLNPVSYLRAHAAGWRWRDEAVGVVMVGFAGLVMVAVLPHLLPSTPFVHLDQGRLHAGVGFIACALILFVLRAPVRALISAVVGSVMLASIALFALTSLAPMASGRQADFTMISFNVLGTNPRGNEIAAYLVDEAPDVLFVMEALAIGNDLEVINATFPYRAGCWPGPRCDMAVYSQHRFDAVDIIPFSTIDGRLIRAQITLDDHQITLLAAHLTKPYWGGWHELQMDRLMEVLADIDGPVVLAGDFNSQAFVRAFRTHLIDQAGMHLATRLQPTWPALASPLLSAGGFAIDHVLVRGDIAPVDVHLIDDPIGSNHRGFISTFDLDGR
ncbi:MAG: endonuclease/exonuclease/phosphatase family protein [Hyphomicrobiales bacterium]